MRNQIEWHYSGLDLIGTHKETSFKVHCPYVLGPFWICLAKLRIRMAIAILHPVHKILE